MARGSAASLKQECSRPDESYESGAWAPQPEIGEGMAKYSLKADERDLPCPICAAPAGERCRTDGHRLARRKAWKTYVRRNSADVLFREDLLAEVSEAAERRGEELARLHRGGGRGPTGSTTHRAGSGVKEITATLRPLTDAVAGVRRRLPLL